MIHAVDMESIILILISFMLYCEKIAAFSRIYGGMTIWEITMSFAPRMFIPHIRIIGLMGHGQAV